MRRWWGFGTALLSVVALLSVARCVVTMVYLGFAFRIQVDPVATPASYYVFTDGGGPAFVSATVALAVATLATLAGLTWAGVRMSGRPTVLFAVWSSCLVTAAIFPTDDGPDIVSLAGLIHQFAGAGILFLLSMAGLAAAKRLAEQPAWQPIVTTTRVLSFGAAVLTVAYLLNRAIQFIPGADMPFDGVLQRMCFAFQMAVVAALAAHLLRISLAAVRAELLQPRNPS
jgi:hypothetical protein